MKTCSRCNGKVVKTCFELAKEFNNNAFIKKCGSFATKWKREQADEFEKKHGFRL